MFALVIVVFSISAAFVVVLRAHENNNTSQKIRAQQLAGRLLYEIQTEKEYIDESYESEGLSIEKEFVWYDRERGLMRCSVKIYDNKGVMLTERRRIVRYEE